jgi:hypothetical protein
VGESRSSSLNLWRLACTSASTSSASMAMAMAAAEPSWLTSHPSSASRVVGAKPRPHEESVAGDDAAVAHLDPAQLVVLNDELLDADFDDSDDTSHALGPIGGGQSAGWPEVDEIVAKARQPRRKSAGRVVELFRHFGPSVPDAIHASRHPPVGPPCPGAASGRGKRRRFPLVTAPQPLDLSVRQLRFRLRATISAGVRLSGIVVPLVGSGPTTGAWICLPAQGVRDDVTPLTTSRSCLSRAEPYSGRPDGW